MGTEYSCQTVESEEETVNKIFKEMFRKDYQPSIIYQNFLNCIYIDQKLKIYKLHKELFQNFLYYVLEDNRYTQLYKDYFNSILSKYNDINCIRKIGLILIDIGTKKEFTFTKKKIYIEHFTKFYLDYNEVGITNELDKTKYKNFDEKNLDIKNNSKDDPNFLNFFKKKELENLDSSIKICISDIIDNNTNCLCYSLTRILNGRRLDMLMKSWGKNNKKLLLLEIHRNYTSLVEKFCIFPNNSSGLKDNSFVTRREKIETKENELFLTKSEENLNNRKIKMEIDEFIHTKNKLIENFFELSENQLTGDIIRNWLYDNSKY